MSGGCYRLGLAWRWMLAPSALQTQELWMGAFATLAQVGVALYGYKQPRLLVLAHVWCVPLPTSGSGI